MQNGTYAAMGFVAVFYHIAQWSNDCLVRAEFCVYTWVGFVASGIVGAVTLH